MWVYNGILRLSHLSKVLPEKVRVYVMALKKFEAMVLLKL